MLYRTLLNVVWSPSIDFIASLKGFKIAIISRIVSHLSRLSLFLCRLLKFLLIKTRIKLLSSIANSSMVSHKFHLILLSRDIILWASFRKAWYCSGEALS